jgi:hypothetical protein
MANTSTAKFPNNQPGKASKPANQGGAGKANIAKPVNAGMPKASKPGATTTMFTKAPKGTRGSK